MSARQYSESKTKTVGNSQAAKKQKSSTSGFPLPCLVPGDNTYEWTSIKTNHWTAHSVTKF